MAIQLSFPLTLASGSWGRKWVLEKAGYQFDIRPADIFEETDTWDGDIRHYVADLAWRKAAAVAPKVSSGLVISADTVGWIDGQVMGKPDDADHARKILMQMAGRIHELWTGVCVWRVSDGLQFVWQELSEVKLKALTQTELDEYIATRQWEGCSGAYAIQEENDPYLTIVSGTLSNVIGLPIESLERVLRML
jgi:septum formation protein